MNNFKHRSLIIAIGMLLVIIVACGKNVKVINEKVTNNMDISVQGDLLRDFKFKPGISSINLDKMSIDGLSFNGYTKKSELQHLFYEFVRNGSIHSQVEINQIIREINRHIEEYIKDIINKSKNENITIEEAKSMLK